MLSGGGKSYFRAKDLDTREPGRLGRANAASRRRDEADFSYSLYNVTSRMRLPGIDSCVPCQR